MTLPYRTSISVRLFDCDAQGHLSGAAYLNYASHALWSCVRAAGVDVEQMLRDGLGPVHLETKIRYLREFRCGDEIDVTCDLTFDGSKVYRVMSEFMSAARDLGAAVESVCGLLDLSTRRLHGNPAEQWRQRAARPEMLGL